MFRMRRFAGNFNSNIEFDNESLNNCLGLRRRNRGKLCLFNPTNTNITTEELISMKKFFEKKINAINELLSMNKENNNEKV